MSNNIAANTVAPTLTELLNSLKELQHHDARLDAAIKQQVELPQLLQRCQAEIEALEAQHTSEAELLERQEAKCRTTENSKQSLAARLAKDQERLNTLRTNEEFHALQKEIDNLTAMLQQSQRDFDAAHQKRDELKKSLADLDSSLATKQQALTDHQATLQDKVAANERLIVQLRHQRPAVAEKIAGQPILALYETIRKKTPLALITIDKPFCNGCKMSLPPQFFNNILAMKSIYQCPTCFRILCYERSA